jgi:hypothetical protein
LEIQLAEPPGVRSCNQGGAWDACRGPGGRNTNYWMAEYEAMRRLCSEADGRLVKAELRTKMRRAELGGLVFGKDRDVNRMNVSPIVLEIRVRKNIGTDDGDRVIRLYFSEPANVDGLLLASKLGHKHPLGKAEQDEHAIEAGNRVRAYFA